MKTAITLTLAIVCAILLSALGPTLDDHSGESAAADAAIAEHHAEIKALRAAIEMCGGENAIAQDMGGGAYQCFTHRSYRTITARVEK